MEHSMQSLHQPHSSAPAHWCEGQFGVLVDAQDVGIPGLQSKTVQLARLQCDEYGPACHVTHCSVPSQESIIFLGYNPQLSLLRPALRNIQTSLA